MATYNGRKSGRARQWPVGFKLRCGGDTPEAYPTPEQVAFVLSTCARIRIPFKATAGLHHPVRHYSEQANAHVHGFVNVFGAAVLAYVNGVDEEQLKDILMDRNPAHFAFASDCFAWKNLRAPLARIESARQHFATSFGSCSFDEPRADLQDLGWI